MAKFYVICHVILCHDRTICHDMRFISEVLIDHCMKESVTHYLCMLVFGELRVHVTLHKQEYRSNFLHFVSASCVFR